MITALPALKYRTTYITMLRVSEFIWQEGKGSATCFNKKIPTTLSFCRRFLLHQVPVRRILWERKEEFRQVLSGRSGSFRTWC